MSSAKRTGENAGLRWTGHALVDVGAAGLCAFCGQDRPDEITLEDLDRAADFMIETYYGGKLGPYLTCVFPNSSFVQPNEKRETREEFIRQYVRAHRAEPHPLVASERCAFSGRPATSPVYRTHLPLFSGEGVMNFRPDARTWLPVAGPFVVALLFLPMAGRRAEGKLLAVYSDDSGLMMAFARRYLEDNQRLLALQLPTERALVHQGYDRERAAWDATKKHYKFADAKGPRSLVVADLTDIASRAAAAAGAPGGGALTTYLLSNSGQGPSLEVFEIPSGVTRFVRKAAGPRTRAAWQSVAQRFRSVKRDSDEEESPRTPAGPKKKGRSKAQEQPISGRAGWSRNPAFEELCDIFTAGFVDRAAALRWLSRFVLGRVEKVHQVTYEAAAARNWALTELFLEEVVGMRKGRIEAIKGFADKLATHIHKKNDRRMFRALAWEKPWELRQSLLRAQRESAASGSILFGLDEYTTVWLTDDADRSTESLVRDLICIRVVETLYELGYFAEHPDDALDKPDQPSPTEQQEEIQ